MADLPVLLTVREAADQLRISRTTLYDVLASGALPSLRIGARRLIRTDDLVTFIDASTAGVERAAAS